MPEASKFWQHRRRAAIAASKATQRRRSAASPTSSAQSTDLPSFQFCFLLLSDLGVTTTYQFPKKGEKEKSFDFWPRAAAVVDRAEESQKMNGKEEDFFFYSVDY